MPNPSYPSPPSCYHLYSYLESRNINALDLIPPGLARARRSAASREEPQSLRASLIADRRENSGPAVPEALDTRGAPTATPPSR
jgi:hypothetical protein